MNDLREYLEFVRPWDDNSLKVVTTEWLPPNQTKKALMKRGAETLEDAVSLIQFYDGRGENTWFSTQTFSRNPAAVLVGRSRWYKNVHRDQAHVTAMHCFHTDMDVKPGAYATLQDAVDAIYAFCSKLNVPPPSLLVCSGYGLHVYWRIDVAMTIQQWQPVANALRNAMQREGIHADHQCTIDAARILRPAGTRNWKDPQNPQPTYIIPGCSKQVYPLQWMIDPLMKFAGPHIASIQGKVVGPIATGVNGLNRNLTAGVDESLPVDLHEIATECAVFEEQFALRGAGASQPLWALVAMASVFDKNGFATFEELSDGYAGYNVVDAQKKFVEKANARQSGTGWPSCQAFSAVSPHCQSCPHFAAGKTPLHLKAKPQAAPGVLPGVAPSLPHNYWQEVDGTIWTNVTDPKGIKTAVCVLGYALSDGVLLDSDDLMFTAVISQNDVRTIRVSPNRHVFKDIAGELFSQGLKMPEAAFKKVGEFIVAWVTHLQRNGSTRVRTTQLGWGEGHSFTHNNQTWKAGATSKAVFNSQDASVATRYEVKGSPQPWADLMQLLSNAGEPALEVAVATSFAAPLIEVGGQKSVLVALSSDHSGSGKSTCIQAGAAVWGHPVTTVNNGDDTQNAQFVKAAATRSMPWYWDETHQGKDNDYKTEQLVSLIFRLGQGRGKDRLKSNLDLRDAKPFQTMLVTGSNHSMAEKIMRATVDTDAGLARVFEIRMPSFARRELAIDNLVGQLPNNHGHAGQRYAEWLSRNAEMVAKAFAQLAEQVDKAFALQTNERYYGTAITALLLGARCAEQARIASFDTAAMRVFLAAQLERLRSHRKINATSPTSQEGLASLIAQLIRENKHVMITDDISVGQGGAQRQINVKGDLAALDRMTIWGQYAEKPNLLRVVRAEFAAWLVSKGQSAWGVIDELESKYGAQRTRSAIGAGTPLAHRFKMRSPTLDVPLGPLTPTTP